MGYYTSYSLAIEGEKKLVKQFEKDLLEKSGLASEVEDLIHDGYVWAKLYDISEWITELAPKYPELLIMLSGDGEDSDDLWEERWCAGEHELQQATIPPFTKYCLLTKAEKEK